MTDLGCFCHQCGTGNGTLRKALVARRNVARLNGDYQTADHIRTELQAAGLIVEDTPDGTKTRSVYHHRGWVYTP